MHKPNATLNSGYGNLATILKASDYTTKMILLYPTYQSNSVDSTEIYDLPGTLMCDPCGGTTGARSNRMAGGGIQMRNYPNPADAYTIIEYELPEKSQEGSLKIYNVNGVELKSYTVDKAFDHLKIATNNLPQGVYFYSIITDNGQTESKKMLIVR